MRSIHLPVLVFFVVSVMVHSSYANLSPIQQTLPASLKASTLIVVGKIQAVREDDSFMHAAPGEYPKKSRALDLSVPGRYTIAVSSTFIGRCPATITVGLAAAMSENYDNAKFDVGVGSPVMLFLTRNDDGTLVPTETTTPFIVLSRIPEGIDDDEQTQDKIEAALLASMQDSSLQTELTFFLRSMVDDTLPAKLQPFLSGAEDPVTDNILYCDLVNQDIAAIPLAAELERKLYPTEDTVGGSANCLTALQYLQNRQAAPYLDLLLLERPYYTRLNAMLALNRLADRHSLPYLILAMRDPDPQEYVQFAAYRRIITIIPRMPHGTNDVSQYYAHKTQYDAVVLNWWHDELSGKHSDVRGSETPEGVPDPLNSASSIFPVQLLSVVSSDRLNVIKSTDLDLSSDHRAILLLALFDPDTAIEFEAYLKFEHRDPALPQVHLQRSYELLRSKLIDKCFAWRLGTSS